MVQMVGAKRVVIHKIGMVAGEHQKVRNSLAEDDIHVLIQCITGTAVPSTYGAAEIRLQKLHASSFTIQIPGSSHADVLDE
jgi:hypothetical protein